MAAKFCSTHKQQEVLLKVEMEVFKLLIVVFTIVSRSNGSSIKDSIKTLENLLVNFKSALTVNAFLCWEPGNFRYRLQIISVSLRDSLSDYSIHLMKALNERNFMVSIQKSSLITELPTHQHNNFIVFDIACENSKQLLDRVIVEALKKYFLSVVIAFDT